MKNIFWPLPYIFAPEQNTSEKGNNVEKQTSKYLYCRALCPGFFNLISDSKDFVLHEP